MSQRLPLFRVINLISDESKACGRTTNLERDAGCSLVTWMKDSASTAPRPFAHRPIPPGATLLRHGHNHHSMSGAIHDDLKSTKDHVMPQATLRNQQTLIANDRTIIANQRKILRNQDQLKLLLRNQSRILRNQQAILKNQKKILSNQARILAK